MPQYKKQPHILHLQQTLALSNSSSSSSLDSPSSCSSPSVCSSTLLQDDSCNDSSYSFSGKSSSSYTSDSYTTSSSAHQESRMPQPGNDVAPAEGVTYVGIDTLQEQTRIKALRRGYSFNLIVVGRSGLGKSTMVNTLFKASVARRKQGDKEPLPSTTEVKSVSASLTEGGVRLNLTVTDTPGFGDHVNNENCWEPIVNFIEDQYAKYLKEEVKIDRPLHIEDTRVHCCVYFIPPTGHSLSSLDVEVLQRLDKIVNVVPVIAKADTLTLEERMAFKERIRADLQDHGIQVYPVKEFEDLEDVQDNAKIRERLPFAVVGSTIWHDLHGKKVLGRRSNWGLVEVENKHHNDFAYLRDMVIRTHMQDLLDTTALRHYENFRRSKLVCKETLINGKDSDSDHVKDLNESNI
ncbi:neuronal-specific septin-3-like [Penaeus japonicus]|uniref:neuronal-specific septin-3-like n=1 Tax=Penaeus japonicus TaxID=27405 RepID=UPI001C70EB93|nr:neuronal-specific septin-3-like [Penaeus japonicus]XP_042868350.1 neuronal-specific septin-3-like [Penaeus japonicus]